MMRPAVEDEGWADGPICAPELAGWADGPICGPELAVPGWWDDDSETEPKPKPKPKPEIRLTREEESILFDLEEQPLRFIDTHLHQTPSYFKDERCPSPHQKMDLYSRRYPKFSYENIEAPLRYRLAATLRQYHVWGAFVGTDYFELAVQVAATLVYLLYPKEILFMTVNYTESIKQKNQLWEQLVILGNKACPIEDACKLIIQLTSETDKYSLVTEADVSDMLLRYCAQLKIGSFRLPFQFDPSSKPQKNPCPRPDSFKQGLLIRSIFEVVEKMEPPPELMVDDLTRLLIKIVKKEVDRKWLLNFALEKMVHTSATNMHIRDKLFVDSGTECSHDRMSRAFDSLMYVLLSNVSGMMVNKILKAELPLSELIQSNSYFHVSVEVTDLLYVAELRRLAEGDRFISRIHILWAFHELGNGLRGLFGFPEILTSILFELPDHDHPPYDIYLASMKVAEYFGDKVRLENFLFVVLHLNNIYLSRDVEQCKEMVMGGYKDFLTALRRSSSNSRDLEGPIFIKDFPGMLQDIQLEFKW